MKWGLVFGFGGLGALLRVAIVSLFPVASGPVATLVVNVVGCLAIGALFALFEERDLASAELRIGLVAGLLGGFTTFSAFGIEILQLLEERRWLTGFGYAGGSVVLGVAAVAIGTAIVREIL